MPPSNTLCPVGCTAPLTGSMVTANCFADVSAGTSAAHMLPPGTPPLIGQATHSTPRLFLLARCRASERLTYFSAIRLDLCFFDTALMIIRLFCLESKGTGARFSATLVNSRTSGSSSVAAESKRICRT